MRVKGFGGRESLKLSFDEFVRRIRTIEKKKKRKEERKKERNNYSVGWRSQVASRNQRAEAG